MLLEPLILHLWANYFLQMREGKIAKLPQSAMVAKVNYNETYFSYSFVMWRSYLPFSDLIIWSLGNNIKLRSVKPIVHKLLIVRHFTKPSNISVRLSNYTIITAWCHYIFLATVFVHSFSRLCIFSSEQRIIASAGLKDTLKNKMTKDYFMGAFMMLEGLEWYNLCIQHKGC